MTNYFHCHSYGVVSRANFKRRIPSSSLFTPILGPRDVEVLVPDVLTDSARGAVVVTVSPQLLPPKRSSLGSLNLIRRLCVCEGVLRRLYVRNGGSIEDPQRNWSD